MASFSRRERITTDIEYTIPTYGSGGCAMGEFLKAYHVAIRETQDKGIKTDNDDWAYVDHDDENIIIRIRNITHA